MLLLEEEEIEGGVGIVAKTLGLRPFRVQHTWEDPDGYVRADVTWFGDGFDDADVDERYQKELKAGGGRRFSCVRACVLGCTKLCCPPAKLPNPPF